MADNVESHVACDSGVEALKLVSAVIAALFFESHGKYDLQHTS